MPYEITLYGLAPSARFPATAAPWTQARIEAAPPSVGVPGSGTFAAVETITLAPVEPDPTQPLRRDLTTLLAPYPDGWYRVVWLDAGGRSETSPPMRAGVGSQSGLPAIPTVRDVAALLRTRLRLAGGSTPDTFTASTNPTAAQVQTLIEMQAAMVLLDTGDLSDATLTCRSADIVRQGVRTVIAMRVAATVEASYWPEEVGANAQTVQAVWQAILTVDQPAVVQAARECRLGDVVPGDEPGNLQAVGAYARAADPTYDPEMAFSTYYSQGRTIGYGTEW